jgi:hypothetical protein
MYIYSLALLYLWAVLRVQREKVRAKEIEREIERNYTNGREWNREERGGAEGNCSIHKYKRKSEKRKQFIKHIGSPRKEKQKMWKVLRRNKESKIERERERERENERASEKERERERERERSLQPL